MTLAVGEQCRVAVVDDDPVFREITCAMLSHQAKFKVYPAASDQDLFDLLTEHEFDCIVLDYDLGECNGLEIKSRIDGRFADPPPIVMLTGDERGTTVLKAFRMGVHDYLPKHNLQLKALVSAVVQAIKDERDRKEKKDERQRLIDSASIDFVSGLFGRAHLDERLTQLSVLPHATRTSYALILVELANYTSILQNVGLKKADTAIRAFAKQLKDGTRSEDVCGRYEHSTFLIIADFKADTELLRGACERFAVNQRMTVELDAAKLVLEATVAGALCDVDDSTPGLDPARLLEPVKRLMVEGKAAGRACTVARTSSAPRHGAEAPARSPSMPAAERLRPGDRRSEPRRRVLKRGIVHLLGSESAFNCTVRNVSDNGAGLRLDTPFAAPASFDLEIIGSGVRRRATLQWQAGCDFGVSFRAS